MRIPLLGTSEEFVHLGFLVLLFDVSLNCGIEIVEATQKVMMGLLSVRPQLGRGSVT